MRLLRRIGVEGLATGRRGAVDAATLAGARDIVEDVRVRGGAALRAYAVRFGDVAEDGALVIGRGELEAAFAGLGAGERALLERTAGRVRRFAEVQRAALQDVSTAVPGGRAGHTVVPMARAGCYAPGGRFPLPSSVLMTAITARVAGVREVWVASPRPAPATLAAAWVAGADGLLAVGGAHAIAALAYGVAVPACDVVVGPGNRWVTAAKQVVAGDVAIDMLAGPSELVVLADAAADAAVVAADLLAQAEHDPDAVPVLVTTDAGLAERVEIEVARQLAALPEPNQATARAACANGMVVLARDLEEAIAACNRLAPEHLELMIAAPRAIAGRLTDYGALFIGAGAAEVLGDYGAGPNHVLPTGGTARHTGGLSVFTFLRVRTWLEMDDGEDGRVLVEDAAALARIEGLEGHARAALARLPRG